MPHRVPAFYRIILIFFANLWSGHYPFMNRETETQDEKPLLPFKDLLLPRTSASKTDNSFSFKVSCALIFSSEIGIKWIRWHFKLTYEHLSTEQFLEAWFCGSVLDVVCASQTVILVRVTWGSNSTLTQRRWGLEFSAFLKSFQVMLILVNKDHIMSVEAFSEASSECFLQLTWIRIHRLEENQRLGRDQGALPI